MAVQALAVLAGRTQQVTGSLTAQACQHGLAENQRTGVEACMRYLTSNEEYLRYDEALASGWPIATGVIEGACRHLIGDRLDITGSRWGVEGAEAILRLRAVIDNGDFEAYWAFHLRCEHDRVHQARCRWRPRSGVNDRTGVGFPSKPPSHRRGRTHARACSSIAY